jgi:hypothetical protein
MSGGEPNGPPPADARLPGGVSAYGYLVTRPRRNAVDIYDERTWRKVGTFLLPPGLRPKSANDYTDSWELCVRWHAAIAALGFVPEGMHLGPVSDDVPEDMA